MNEKIERLKNDIVFFAEKILNFKPFPYQKQILLDNNKRIIICAGRQIGKTTIIAVKAIYFAVTNPRTTTLIVSATLRQSMLMFQKIVEFVESSILKQSVVYKTRTQIIFSNHSKIIALPCGRFGTTLRGHTAHLIILDEAAFMPEEVITNVVMPMISTTDGALWLLSTPWGTDHIFYKIWVSGEDWSKYHFPSSVNPLIKKEFLEEQKKLIGEELFAIEYLAEFREEQSSYFPMKLLREACEDYTPTLVEGSVAGYDPGGKESLAAFVAVKQMGDKIYITFADARHSEKYANYNGFIFDLHKKKPFRKILVDQTGLGAPVVEHLAELCGKNVVEGIVLTPRVKEELMSNLRMLLEEKRLVLPQTDFQLLNAINCVTYERTRAGGYTFSHREGTHDDLAYALALACYNLRGAKGTIVAIKK